MAYQTPYADIPLNTRAIANYNNPIFDVLRNGLGWLENQEQKIADRKKFELLKQIQDDAMTDKYTQAKNANEDLAKQLYGNSYFVNSDDADLAKAMEALKIRESNKMLDTLGRDIASKVNQDIYKAGNEQELLSSLGFNNRTQDELNKVKDFAQEQLKNRYKPYIQGKLADREIDGGKVSEQDIDALVDEFRDKYGMDIDPSTLYDPANRKELRQGGINKRIGEINRQIINKQISPEDAINYLYMLQGMNPENSVEISNTITNLNAIKTKKYTDTATRTLYSLADKMQSESSDGTIDMNKLRVVFKTAAMQLGIPMETAMDIYNKYVIKDGSLNPELQRLNKERSTIQSMLDEEKKGDLYRAYETIKKSGIIPNTDDKTQNYFNEVIKESAYKDSGISQNDFTDFMAYLAAAVPATREGLGKDSKEIKQAIRSAIQGFKDNPMKWRNYQNQLNEIDLGIRGTSLVNIW